MKFFRFLLVWLVTFLCLFTWSGFSNTEASDYLGEYCESISVAGLDETCLLKLGVYDMSNGHFYLSGIIDCDEAYPVHGNIESINGNLVGSLIQTGGSTFGVLHITVDSNTFSGQVEALDLDFRQQTGVLETKHMEGTLTFITCP
jgi:hypothetical protein